MPPRSRVRASSASRNPQLESMLTERGFSWDYREGVAIDEIDHERSRHNQARLHKPIDGGTVERYTQALGNGEVFPAILVAETSSTAKLLIVDGNHRDEAHQRAEMKTIDCYVITGASSQAITMLTFEANTRHGLPSSEADRLHQALYLMDNGISAEEAARRLGLKVGTLRTAANIAAVDRRADEVGLIRPRWDRLPVGTKTRLGQLSTDEGFGEMAKLAIDAGMKTDEVSSYVGQANALRSSKKQVEFVKALRATLSEALQVGSTADVTTRGRQTRTGRYLYRAALGQLAVLPAPEAIVERMTEDDRSSFIEQTQEALRVLTTILEALKQ